MVQYRYVQTSSFISFGFYSASPPSPSLYKPSCIFHSSVLPQLQNCSKGVLMFFLNLMLNLPGCTLYSHVAYYLQLFTMVILLFHGLATGPPLPTATPPITSLAIWFCHSLPPICFPPTFFFYWLACSARQWKNWTLVVRLWSPGSKLFIMLLESASQHFCSSCHHLLLVAWSNGFNAVSLIELYGAYFWHCHAHD